MAKHEHQFQSQHRNPLGWKTSTKSVKKSAKPKLKGSLPKPRIDVPTIPTIPSNWSSIQLQWLNDFAPNPNLPDFAPNPNLPVSVSLDLGFNTEYNAIQTLESSDTIIGYAEAWKIWYCSYQITDRSLILNPMICVLPSLGPVSDKEYQAQCHCSRVRYHQGLIWLNWTRRGRVTFLPSRFPFVHECGFYGFKKDGFDLKLVKSGVETLAVGRVAFYGNVVECQYGYRAEKMRLLDLWVPENVQDEVKYSSLIRGTVQVMRKLEEPLPGKLLIHPKRYRLGLRLNGEVQHEIWARNLMR
jgi:hypothetical protein